jgi:hypothetical protein
VYKCSDPRVTESRWELSLTHASMVRFSSTHPEAELRYPARWRLILEEAK